MPSEKLIRSLNSIGKEVFITYFDLFKDFSAGRIDKEQAVRKLVSDGISNESGAKIRVSNAKTIFSNKWEKDALFIIKDARVSDELKKQATKLTIRLSR